MPKETLKAAELDAARRALFEKRLRSLRADTSKAQMECRSDSRKGELSYGQRRIWFLSKLAPNSGQYNIIGPIRFKGRLSVVALSDSLTEIVRRHENLRAVFVESAEGPQLKVVESRRLLLGMVDLTSSPEETAERIASGLTVEDAERPFDLAAGPLIRATLIRLPRDRSLLLLTLHHIIADAWSRNLLAKELSHLYRRYALGSRSEMPELEIQYSDHAAWQREWLESPAATQQLDYWRRQLENIETLRLPIDRPRPEVLSLQGAVCECEIDESLGHALREMARSQSVSLYMFMLAAFGALLQRYTGQTEIVIGTPIANRSRAEVQDLIGFFLNILVMRLQVSEHLTFRALLNQVRNVCLAAYEHQDFPFDRLVEELRPARDLSTTPLFQVGFTLQQTDASSLSFSEVSISAAEVDVKTAKYDWTVDVLDCGSTLRVRLEYRTDLFAESSIDTVLSHYRAVLRAAVANMDTQVGLLDIFSPGEREELTNKWNETHVPGQGDVCIHERIEAVVKRTPDTIAISTGDSAVSYGELNRRANLLAHFLRVRGVREETLVGIVACRAPETILCKLAVLKTGAAYLPLDPAHPLERHRSIAAETRMQIVLIPATGAVDPHLADGTFECIDVETVWNEIVPEHPGPVSTSAIGDNLAYVIYTSGSTGVPKGVMLQHRGLANFVGSQIQELALNAASRTLLFALSSVDASVTEIFPSLACGATVCVAPKEQLLGGPGMVRLLQQLQITHVVLPPSVLALLPPEDLESLETVVSAGEPCSESAAERWRTRVRFCNGYGPTETTVGPLLFRASNEPFDWRGVPIGKPVWNTQAYVLNACYELVPANVLGEIMISGHGLARGYFKRPDLTAERFVPNQFSHGPGVRMFRTGDLGRRWSDGNIQYAGRKDHQVKIRGNRIELEEIESILKRHGAVQEACVFVSGESSNKHLIAVVAAAGASGELAPELQQLLRDTLPEYMRPSNVKVIADLPRLATGKVDRRRVTFLYDTTDAPSTARVPPRTEEERVVATVWQEVLKRAVIGVDENFFEAGGHSLLLALLSQRLTDALGREVSILELYRFPTISSFLRHVGDGMRRPAPAKRDQSRGHKQQVAEVRRSARRLDERNQGSGS